MKYIISAIALIIIFEMCGAKKTATVQYNFPPMMNDTIRKVTQEQCDKGLVLFRLNCSKCHADTVKGKEVIPSFSSEQLSNYEFRFRNKKHEDNLTESKLSQDELIMIITFLTYKK